MYVCVSLSFVCIFERGHGMDRCQPVEYEDQIHFSRKKMSCNGPAKPQDLNGLNKGSLLPRICE